MAEADQLYGVRVYPFNRHGMVLGEGRRFLRRYLYAQQRAQPEHRQGGGSYPTVSTRVNLYGTWCIEQQDRGR